MAPKQTPCRWVAEIKKRIPILIRNVHYNEEEFHRLITPLFLLFFASTYLLLSRNDPTTFTEPLSRSDALYLTVTIFATVGFGDISAQVETARLVVTVQMLLDLVVLGLGIQVILGAVKRGKADDDS